MVQASLKTHFFGLSSTILSTFKIHCLLSFIAGLCLVFAYAPFGFWPVTIIVPALWLTLMDNKPFKKTTIYGLFFGLGWFGSGISWVHVSIDKFGGMPFIVTLLLMLLLCTYLAIYPALACYLSSRLTKKRLFNGWLFPSAWLFSEFLRSIILTGFPWLSLGYSQIDSPLSALAPIIGEVGITFILLILATCLSQLILKNKIRSHLLIITIILILTWVLSQPTWTTSLNKQANVALVQGNIKQEMRWQAQQEWPTMLKYLDLTRANYDADLIVWPESAVPKLEPLAQEYLTMVNTAAAFNNSAIITGIQNYDVSSKAYFNGLIVLGKKDQQSDIGQYYYQTHNRYYKHHLLPIGEFVPFGDLLRPLAPLFNLPMSSFSRGDYQQPNIRANGLNVLPLICFEIVFAEQLRANFNDDTNLLLTVSNDAWFGDSHGPHQHLEITRMRALEFGRPILRSTNNGVTAIIDHLGKIIKQAPQFIETVLRAQVNLVTGRTPFSYWGHWLAFLLALILFASVQIKERYSN